ncbi:MAG TPA: ABC transporter ATP-binding protein [Terriglobales bacterium]|nr:ABC transporter ATP-binding protein [Terriglobales bacterium]
MDALLEVRELQVDYLQRSGKNTRALQGVSFALGVGEILGIIGESGSGKSTLATAILGMLQENERILGGSILLSSENVLEKTSRELREMRGGRVGIVFQEPSLALHPTKTIGVQVWEVLRAHCRLSRREAWERVHETLTTVFGAEAKRISSSFPHELSGGQKQRAAIAQAIVCGPEVIVADEPTASLDTDTQHAIMSLFRELQKKLRVAIVFITHNPILLAEFADRILVFYGGRIAEQGETKEVLASPRHPYTKMLLQCLPELEARADRERPHKLPVVAGEPISFSILSQGCNFVPRCPEKMKICEQESPSLRKEGEAHEVSCFLFRGSEEESDERAQTSEG